MTVSVLSEPKFLEIHNEFLSYLRRSEYATKNYGPFTKEHKITFTPVVSGRNLIKTTKSDLYDFILSLDIGYLPKLWQEGYTTNGNFGVVITDTVEISRIVDLCVFEGINNILVFNPNIHKFEEIKQIIDLHFNKIIIQKSALCFK